MFYQIFFSPQVKRWTIITYKNGLYELPHEMLNDFSFKILDSDLNVPRHFHRWVALCPHKKKRKKKDLRSQEITTYQESDPTPQNDTLVPSPPAKLKIFSILAKKSLNTEMKPFPQCTTSQECLSPCFKPKLEQLSGERVLKYALLPNGFSYLFTNVEIWY